jgi:uncharacterized membrane protein HdeD (DUF308 family)
MGYPPQGTGINEQQMRNLLAEERKRTRRWQILSLVLGLVAVVFGLIAIIEPFIL